MDRQPFFDGIIPGDVSGIVVIDEIKTCDTPIDRERYKNEREANQPAGIFTFAKVHKRKIREMASSVQFPKDLFIATGFAILRLLFK